MFKDDKKLSNTEMLIMASVFLATPVIGFLKRRIDMEERDNRR